MNLHGLAAGLQAGLRQRLRFTLRQVGATAAAAILCTIGAGFLVAANHLWLMQHFPAHLAALITGLELIVLGALVAGIAARRRRRESRRRAAQGAEAPIGALMEDLTRAAGEHPVQTLLLALAAGIGTGLATTPRRH